MTGTADRAAPVASTPGSAMAACLAGVEACATAIAKHPVQQYQSGGIDSSTQLASVVEALSRAVATLNRLAARPEPKFVEPLGDRNLRRALQSPALQVPVRMRDGDNCRYCGTRVHWIGRRSERSAHLHPLVLAVVGSDLFPACVVTVCAVCEDKLTVHELPLVLQPEPANPWYSNATADLLTAHGHDVSAGRHVRDGAEVSG